MRTTKEEEMLSHAEEWGKSGLSLKEFAASLGIAKSTLEYWVRKSRKRIPKATSFIELAPVAGQKGFAGIATNIRKEVSPHASIEITLPGGMYVKIYG